jgi:hypothetical protein
MQLRSNRWRLESPQEILSFEHPLSRSQEGEMVARDEVFSLVDH